MKRRAHLVFIPCLFILTAFALLTRQAEAQALDASINEQVLMLPVTENGKQLQFETTIYKPTGEGPFPLLLMNHGKERGKPAAQKRDRFLAMGREFVRRGYAVAIPMRKGFSKSDGIYSDFGCNMHDNGMIQADDIEARSAPSPLTNVVNLSLTAVYVGLEPQRYSANVLINVSFY